MRTVLKSYLGVASFSAVATVLFLTAPNTAALDLYDGINAARGDGQPVDLFGPAGILTTLINILLFIVGALSVIMIIIGGLRYVVSGGNATSVTTAKNTILYAIVGLVVALLAFAVVNFVLSAIAPGANNGYTDI